MKINVLYAFVGAVAIHVGLAVLLMLNVSLSKPARPQSSSGAGLIHASLVVPHAQGTPAAAPRVELPRPASAAAAADSQRRTQELRQKVEAQKRQEIERQNAALALRRKEEEQRQKADQERRAAEKKHQEQQRRKAEEARRLAEKKKKEEAQRKRDLEKKLAQQKAEEERRAAAKKKKEEQEAREAAERRKQQELARQLAEQQASAVEDELLGRAGGSAQGKGLGLGQSNSNVSREYGTKIETLVLQNWHIDPSMDGKQVVVTFAVDQDGGISGEQCQGDSAVCKSALDTLRLIGMMPRPPSSCPDCNIIVLTMTPKV